MLQGSDTIDDPMNRALFLLVACFWGGSFVAIKEIVAVVHPVSGAAMRTIVSLVSLILIFSVRRMPMTVERKHLPRLWLAGMFSQALPFLLLFWGETKVSAGLAGILNGTVPLWTLMIGLLFLRDVETFTKRKAGGLALGLIGVAVIFYPSIRFGGESGELQGIIALCGMACCYGIAIVMTRRLQVGKAKIPFQASVFQQQIASTVVLTIIACVVNGPASLWVPWTPTAWGAAVYLGFCSTALAFLIFYHLISTWDAVRASAVTYLVPFVGLILDFVFNGRIPKSNEIIGVFIVMTGVVLVQGFAKGKSSVKS